MNKINSYNYSMSEWTWELTQEMCTPHFTYPQNLSLTIKYSLVSYPEYLLVEFYLSAEETTYSKVDTGNRIYIFPWKQYDGNTTSPIKSLNSVHRSHFLSFPDTLSQVSVLLNYCNSLINDRNIEILNAAKSLKFGIRHGIPYLPWQKKKNG